MVRQPCRRRPIATEKPDKGADALASTLLLPSVQPRGGACLFIWSPALGSPRRRIRVRAFGGLPVLSAKGRMQAARAAFGFSPRAPRGSSPATDL